MVNKTAIIGGIASLGSVLGIASNKAAAQMSHETHEMQSSEIGQTRQFRQRNSD